jgi:uncharacterized repeat protein (TIGR03803 family)
LIAVSVLTFAFATAPVCGQSLSTIYTFHPSGGDSLLWGLLAAGSGNLYGVASSGGLYGYGTVYVLSQTAGGWQETVLYNFTGGADGAYPAYALASDAAHNLYGVATQGGLGGFGYGTVYQLAPPTAPGGDWAFNVIFSFPGPGVDGVPGTSLVLDKSGNLYGGLAFGNSCPPQIQGYGGRIYQLSPPSQPGGSWTETDIYSFPCFGNPTGLTFDAAGNLFGAGYGGEYRSGTVFRLEPAGQSQWTFATLHTFNVDTDGALPLSGVIFDSEGNLYGTTNAGGGGAGTVFELSPPSVSGGAWIETRLVVFHGPNGANPIGAPILDQQGNLYGTTVIGGSSDLGTIFQLQPPASAGNPWTLNTLYSFSGKPDQGYPNTGLIFGPRGLLYGATEGAIKTQYGTVFSIAP